MEHDWWRKGMNSITLISDLTQFDFITNNILSNWEKNNVAYIVKRALPLLSENNVAIWSWHSYWITKMWWCFLYKVVPYICAEMEIRMSRHSDYIIVV